MTIVISQGSSPLAIDFHRGPARGLVNHFRHASAAEAPAPQRQRTTWQSIRLFEVSTAKSTATKVVAAIQHGELAAFARAIRHPTFRPDQYGSSGITPMTAAAFTASANALQILVACGANTGGLNRDGTTPLTYAAARNKVAAITLLLSGTPTSSASSSGCDATKPDGRTAVETAILHGHTEALDTLLAWKAEQPPKDQGKRLLGSLNDALDLAVQLKRFDMAEKLVSGMVRGSQGPVDGYIRAIHGNPGLVRYLHDKGDAQRLFHIQDHVLHERDWATLFMVLEPIPHTAWRELDVILSQLQMDTDSTPDARAARRTIGQLVGQAILKAHFYGHVDGRRALLNYLNGLDLEQRSRAVAAVAVDRHDKPHVNKALDGVFRDLLAMCTADGEKLLLAFNANHYLSHIDPRGGSAYIESSEELGVAFAQTLREPDDDESLLEKGEYHAY